MANYDNVEIVKSFYAAFVEGNVDKLLASITDDLIFEIPDMEEVPLQQIYRGKDGFLQLLEDRERVLVYEAFAVNEFVGERDLVIVLGETQGRVLATNKRFQFHWVEVFRMRDGKIASFREYLDTVSLRAAFIV